MKHEDRARRWLNDSSVMLSWAETDPENDDILSLSAEFAAVEEEAWREALEEAIKQAYRGMICSCTTRVIARMEGQIEALKSKAEVKL